MIYGGKIEKFPLTVPSPSRGEGKHIEIKKEIPSPCRGEGQGGGELWVFFTPSGGLRGDLIGFHSDKMLHSLLMNYYQPQAEIERRQG
jgi:hypothetical protein